MIRALHQILPYDWEQHFTSRVDQVNPRAPLGGMELTGWRLAYGETATSYHKAVQKSYKQLDFRYSGGFVLTEDGGVVDVLAGSAAANAGLSPGMKLLGIHGRRWSEERVHEALSDSRTSTRPIPLLVEDADFFKVIELDFHDGEKYPFMERDSAKPDLLSRIIASRSN